MEETRNVYNTLVRKSDRNNLEDLFEDGRTIPTNEDKDANLKKSFYEEE